MREGKALIDATRPFAFEHRRRSWAFLAMTMALWIAAMFAAVALHWWPARLVAATGAGLMTVRLFIFYHDYLHGALLRDSVFARCLFSCFGVFVLAPPSVWRETHNYHHAHTAKLIG